MRKTSEYLLAACTILTAIAMIVTMTTGCSEFSAPTVSQNDDANADLWNPNPGDQIVPGRDVPIITNGDGLSVDGATMVPVPASAVIGPLGGSVRLGRHILNIPAGAVSENVTFTMSAASQTGVAVDCNPSPFQFNVPVSLTLSFANTQYASNPRQVNLQIFYMANTSSCIAMPSVVDPVGYTVTAQIDHFSRYIIG